MGDYKRVPVPGWEDRYEIDTNGMMYSKKTNKPMRFSVINGYYSLKLRKGKYYVTKLVHRIVAETFIPNPSPSILIQVNHIDGVKTNNRVENLEWVTCRENINKAVEIGLIKKKERTCALCGKKYFYKRPDGHPTWCCSDCREVYRKNVMAKTEENLIRQKQIRAEIARRGIQRSDIERATGRSERSVKDWLNCQINYRPDVLDAIEQELLR